MFGPHILDAWKVSTACFPNTPQNEMRLSMIILLQGRV